MEKFKKILMIISLSTLGIAVLMLISGVIFNLPVFTDKTLLKILLTDATVAITTGISINEISVIKRKKILGFVALGLLLASATLAIILFIVPSLFSNSAMVKATSIVAISSLLFITITSNYSKLDNYLLPFQIISYLVFLAVDTFIALLIAGVNVFFNGGMVSLFVVLCILAVGFMIALSVLSSKRKNEEPAVKHTTIEKIEDENKMIVSKAEYYSMKEEIEKLKNQKVDEDKMLISKAEYYSLKEENLKLKEENLKLKQAE